jgi:myo-inositol 2-dehydrogenase/D-chiro-inositol 1-dehydrogenase
MAKALAVLGTGKIFQNGLAPGLEACRSLVYPKYLCDVNASNIPDYMGATKISFEDFPRVFDDPEIAGYVILSPSMFHLDHIKLIAQTGKPILVEKPVGMNMEEAEEVYRHVPEERLLVGWNKRFDPKFLHMKAKMDAWGSELRKVMFYYTDNPQKPMLDNVGYGSFFMDCGGHYIDLALVATNSLPISVTATGIQLDSVLNPYPEIHDVGFIDMEMESGSHAFIFLTRYSVFNRGSDEFVAMSKNREIVHIPSTNELENLGDLDLSYSIC